MVNVNNPFLHIQILQCQPAKFRDTHSRVEKDINYFVILTVYIIVMDEFQELTHLLSGYRLPGHTVIDHHRSKLKVL